MQRFVVIGLGRFGSRLARNLAAAGREVIAIDRNERIVDDVRDDVTMAIALDATDEQALRSQGIDQVDAAVVGIGENFEASVLCTAVLKQIGVQRVIGRAMTRTGSQILSRIGADEVVNPEDESADRWASRLISPQFLSQFELDRQISIVEVRTPADWVGRTLLDIKPRSELGIHVVAIKRTADDDGAKAGRAVLYLPMPDVPLAGDDLLLLMGRAVDLAQLPTDEE
ncbi:MAG: TrkA family potassium uptake protein [Phycisphaeraceae bacterium]